MTEVRENRTAVAVVQVPRRVLVQAVGAAGPPGPAGASGTMAQLEFSVVAGFDIAAFHLVVPRMVSPSVRLADNKVAAYVNRPLWLAMASALAGEALPVLANGVAVNPGWAWTQGPVFLGVDGQLTQTPPAPPAVFSAQVGYSIGPTSMYLERFAPVLIA